MAVMTPENLVYARPRSFTDTPTHYCPGCTHGTAQRLIAEVLDEMNITSRTIVVMGEVNGDMFGEEQIILRPSSTVHGNLFAPRVTLEDGAKFKGSIDMTTRTAESSVLPAAGSELRSA